MNRIKVVVSGFGKMGEEIFRALLKNDHFEVLPYVLTGKGIGEEIRVNGKKIEFIPNDEKRRNRIDKILQEEKEFFVIDFTRSDAVIPNVELYCEKGLPFVMGTTGGDLYKLKMIIEKSSISAVISPNMALPIVGIQLMMKYIGDNFPGLFAGYSLEVIESHQVQKKGTSGTAISMLEYFSKLGIVNFSEENIQKIRDPEKQRALGVPEKFLPAHGWHTYKLKSSDQDQSVYIELKHNINGRKVYIEGTIMAVKFLKKKIEEGAKGKVFTMIDVLRDLKN